MIFKKSLAVNLAFSVLSLVLFLAISETASWIYYRTHGFLNEYESVIESQGFTPSNKKPGEKRIFVIGESAAEGIPYSREQSFSGFLKTLAQSEDPNIQIINTGLKGRHSFYQLESAKTFVRYKADAVVIYAGNNDSRDFSNVIRDMPLAWLEFKLAWNSYFYWVVKRRILSLRKSINKRSKKEIFNINYNQDDVWHWTDAYIEKKKRYMEDPKLGLERKQQAIRDYENNLHKLTVFLKRKKIAVYVSQLPINHLVEPGVYDIKEGLGPGGKGYDITEKLRFLNQDEEKQWNENYEAGIKALKENKYDEALDFFKRAKKINDLYTLLAHFMGKCYEGLKNFDKAKEYYIRGKDLQIQSPGADSFKNASLKNIAEKTNSPWIELQSIFEEVSTNGIVGENLILDHCHLNLFGNKMIAARIMQSFCDTKLIDCKSPNWTWKDWFAKLANGQLNDENVAKEYLMTAFYLINGTIWQKDPDYPAALRYLQKARDISPKNEQIYPLLALTYLKTQQSEKSQQALLQLKEISPEVYGKTLKEHPELSIN